MGKNKKIRNDIIILVLLVIILAIFLWSPAYNEGYENDNRSDRSNFFKGFIKDRCQSSGCNSYSNDLHPCHANCGATPWSVVPPCWIGQVDQGNGRIGDDALSGYAYYNAY